MLHCSHCCNVCVTLLLLLQEALGLQQGPLLVRC
jgi:hypothetical protein